VPRDTFNIVPGDQSFMNGHQIIRIRRPRRRVPQWVFDDNKIRAFLLRSFPKLSSDDKQRKRAGRWARVIQLYFRTRKSYRETAEEMGESLETTHNIIRRIQRASSGKPVNGVKRNRVRKTRDLNQTEGGD